MSKKNKNNNKKSSKLALTAKKTITSPLEQIEKLESTALATSIDSDLLAVENSQPLQTEVKIEELIKRAQDTLEILNAQRARLAKEEERLASRLKEIELLESEIDETRDALKEQESVLIIRESSIATLEKTLKDEQENLMHRREEISLRELDAETGFRRLHMELIEKLEAERKELKEQYSRNKNKIDEERFAFENEMQEKRNQLALEISILREKSIQETDGMREAATKHLDSLRTELETERAQFATEKKEFRKIARDVEINLEILKEDREALNEKITERSARLIEEKESTIRALNERLEVARAQRDYCDQRLAEREEADRQFGDESPGEILNRLRALEIERDQLKNTLNSRPSAEATQRLEELERQKEVWESDSLRLRAELAEARQEAARKRIAVTELESLRDEKRALESANALLQEVIEQQCAKADLYIKGNESKSPFPSCIAMDSDKSLQSSRQTTDFIGNLATFAEEVQHRMARDPKTDKELFYSIEDVRSFLGGLAMSRLLLLQGISGTGKTSLPLAFARAIGAKSELIEVQAGWRDRQDLIGHFNTFERQFYESEFLKALYRASTPIYKEIPFIIVMDEMNLSHPEQYFADMLSALEQDQHLQNLVLMTAAVDPAPRLLQDGGTKIRIPSNVWFIGTANHDETTKDFADKTYDRAHVMELPRNRESFERRDIPPQNPVSMRALTQAFETAVSEHREAASKAYDFLQTILGDILGNRFRIGWGNRLERQMSYYVPVVVGAGGTLGEATDYILASKLLRKIRDRHDNRFEDLVALREHIEANWKILDQSVQPRRAFELIQHELRRLGYEND